MLQRVSIGAQIRSLGDDEVEVIMSTASLARDGHVLVPGGCVLDAFRKNPVILWQHDPDYPLGNAENLKVGPQDIRARIRFAPAGASAKADEVRGLVKGGVIRAVSVGFDPIEMTPLDPQRPYGGQRITKWELFECSFVSVPADTGAVVTARAKGRAGKVLSGENADKLRQAHDAAQLCRDHIADVLEGAGATSAEEQDQEARQREAEALLLAGTSAEEREILDKITHAANPDQARRQRELLALTRAGCR